MAEYIDKEQVVQYLYNQAEALVEAGGNLVAAACAQGWADAIKRWPAADIRPTVHAHWELCVERTISSAGWVTDTAFHRCSRCHGRPGKGGIGLFCTFCGAKMDEGTVKREANEDGRSAIYAVTCGEHDDYNIIALTCDMNLARLIASEHRNDDYTGTWVERYIDGECRCDDNWLFHERQDGTEEIRESEN